MFMPNDVFQLGESRIRVLYSNKEILFWIDIDIANALPKSVSRVEFEHQMAAGNLSTIEDPYIHYALNTPKKGSKAEEVQNKAWDAIKNIISVQPDIYLRSTRGRLLVLVLEKSGVTKQTVYRWLRRYWQFGMSKNALSGRYEKCGGAGKTRASGDKKRGAPRTRSGGTGINVDEKIRTIFRVALEKSYLNEGKYELDYAYNQMLIAFGVNLPCKPEDLLDVPTERQFKYFLEKEFSPAYITKKREGEINYQKDFRPVLSSSTTEVAGPASRYQIDATIGDIYLVSEQDREIIVGRPTIYFVGDVFSRLITGVYVGFENPSWVSAMEALANAACDKVAYCKKFGIEITTDEWPAAGLPEVIIGDKGEMLGRHIEVLSKSFHIDIENTPSYRADWKGIVERYFRTVQTKFKPFVEGYVTKNPIGKKRHGIDYRQDGTLTLREFTQIIIKIILFHNNEHTLSKYDPDADLPETLPYNPLTLWNWGIEYRTGRLRRPPEKLVKVNLLPHIKATITEHGLKLFGCYYTCQSAVQMGWFEGNYSGPKSVMVAYDLYSANKIYIRTTDNYSEFMEAELTERSREFRDITMWEVWRRNDVKAEVAATSKLVKRAGSVNLATDIEDIVDGAKRARPKKTTMSKAEKVKGISDNKRNERQYEREKQSADISGSENSNPINVTPIRPIEDKSGSFKVPSIKDILKKDKSDE
jgi:putative transposase